MILFLSGLIWLITIGDAKLTYAGQVELDLSAKVIKFYYPNVLNKWYRQRFLMQPDTIPFSEIAEIYQSYTQLAFTRSIRIGLHSYCLSFRTIYQFDYPLVIVKDASEFNEVLAVLRMYFNTVPLIKN
ncbi:MAG: hypothetical protein OHK0019_11740 [Saprospiraceae bacterium]